MRFYGLLDHEWNEIFFWYPSREAAEAEFAELLSDEPEWIEKFELVLVDFSGAEVEVLHVQAR